MQVLGAIQKFTVAALAVASQPQTVLAQIGSPTSSPTASPTPQPSPLIDPATVEDLRTAQCYSNSRECNFNEGVYCRLGEPDCLNCDEQLEACLNGDAPVPPESNPSVTDASSKAMPVKTMTFGVLGLTAAALMR